MLYEYGKRARDFFEARLLIIQYIVLKLLLQNV